MLNDYKVQINDAMTFFHDQEMVGIDPVPDYPADGQDKMQYYVDHILAYAGIDLMSLDESQLSHVQREARILL